MNVVLTVHGPISDSQIVNVDFGSYTISRLGRSVKLGPVSIHAVAAILVSPYRLSMSELINIVYSDDNDGGPLDGSRSIHVLLSRSRPALREIGIGLGAKGWQHAATDLWTAPERLAA